ncbi:MAG TPA: hypothetical protein VHD87_04890 [Acidimicrobiales bacterium]|nr:hypothetical protein [Acidimicrobiales bacterium]
MARVRPAEFTEELNDVWRLVVGYTKQETTAPLRGIGPFMRAGALGMVFFTIGTFFGTLAVVRGLETYLHTWLKAFLPYVGASVWLIIVGGLAYRSMRRTPWKKQGEGK